MSLNTREMGNQASVIQHIKSQLPQRVAVVGDPCIFDAQKYSEKYPDLQNAFRGDANALKRHYIEHGLKEGRTPCGNTNPGCRFDTKTYVSLNQDLNNLPNPEQHYKQNGINEGRAVCPGLQGPPAAPPPPPNPSLFKDQKRIELNMAKQDVVKKQNEYDNLTPEEAVKRKTDEGNKEANDYINSVQTRLNYEVDIYKTKLSEVDTLANSPAFKLAQKYRQDLSTKHSSAFLENKKYKEAYVTNRRRFLDADPSESVAGFGPFKTLDDRIFLLFWFCYLLFLIPVGYHLVSGLGSKIGGTGAQMGTLFGLVLGACIVAHLAIRNLA